MKANLKENREKPKTKRERKNNVTESIDKKIKFFNKKQFTLNKK